MQRVRPISLRHLVLVAVLGLGVALLTSGCQTQPGTAAYVGNTRFTDDQIDAMAASVEADVVTAQPDAKGQLQYGTLRQTLVRLAVFNELAKRYAEENALTVPARDYAAAAQQIGLPASDPYTRLTTDAQAYQTALTASVAPARPTESDLHAAYDKIVAAGLEVGSFDEVKAQIAAVPSLGPGLSLRADLIEASQRYGVGVSPRYLPLEMPLASVSTGSGQTVAIVTLPLGSPTGSPAVRDLA